MAFGSGPTELTGPIIDGRGIRQSFVAVGENLNTVSILFSTYKRQNPGAFYVEVLDLSGNVLAADSIESCKLQDNRYQSFSLPCELRLGVRYELKIRTIHGRSGMSPTLHYTKTKREGYLFLGARVARHCELTCRFDYDRVVSELEVQEAVERESKPPDACNPDLIRDFLSNRNSMVSIVIPNKDGFEHISRCVQSIIDHTACPYEVIIGDTGSKDEKVLGLYEELPGNFRVVSGLEYHFSRLNNELAKEAEGGHLLFLNNDVSFDCDIVSAMLRYSLCFGVGAVGLRLTKPHGTIDHDGQVLWSGAKAVVPDHVNVNHRPQNVARDDCVTQGVTAACMMTRKAIFDRLGGFSEDFEDVYQDCDYCMRLVEKGFNCLTVRSLSAMHVGSATRGPTTSQRASVTRDRARYLERWERRFKAPQRPLFSLITCANDPDLYDGMVKSLPEDVRSLVEWLPVRNHGNVFSVTQALNKGKIAARGRHLVYCHQDIRFSKNWFKDIQAALTHLPDDTGIIGFEGIRRGGTPYSCRNIKIGRPQEVQTLDELCLITSRRSLQFDERFLFHYYGADICLQSLHDGFRNFLVGAVVNHLSGGSENVLKDTEGFKLEAQNFRMKWSDDVWTTTTKFLDGEIVYMICADVLNKE